MLGCLHITLAVVCLHCECCAVHRDLKYFVPNPSFKGKAAKKTPATTIAPAAAPSNPAAADIPPVTQQQQQQQSSAAASAHDSVVVVEVQAGAAAVNEPAEVPEELELLKGVNAFAEPGQLLALMGGSGAGKTTLMDVIAGRKTVGRITGDILVNGRPKQQSSWARQVSGISTRWQGRQCTMWLLAMLSMSYFLRAACRFK